MLKSILYPSSGSDSEDEDIGPPAFKKGKSTDDMKADFPKKDGAYAEFPKKGKFADDMKENFPKKDGTNAEFSKKEKGTDDMNADSSKKDGAYAEFHKKGKFADDMKENFSKKDGTNAEFPKKGKITDDMKADFMKIYGTNVEFPKKGKSAFGIKTDIPNMWTLEHKRRVRITEFRGKKLIDIREYYTKDGQELPGNKGISLTIKQWNKLKETFDDINKNL